MTTHHKTTVAPIWLLASVLALTGCNSANRESAGPQNAIAPETTVTSPPLTAPQPSPAETATSTATHESHQDGWQALLLAMQSGDVARVKVRSTEAGYASLKQGVGEDDPSETYQRWGKGWAAWEIRWQEATDSAARAYLGPEVKEHGIWLSRDGSTWKLDRWAPGE